MSAKITSKDYIKELIEEAITAAVEYGQAMALADEDNGNEAESEERNLQAASEMLYQAIDNLVDN